MADPKKEELKVDKSDPKYMKFKLGVKEAITDLYEEDKVANPEKYKEKDGGFFDFLDDTLFGR